MRGELYVCDILTSMWPISLKSAVSWCSISIRVNFNSFFRNMKSWLGRVNSSPVTVWRLPLLPHMDALCSVVLTFIAPGRIIKQRVSERSTRPMPMRWARPQGTPTRQTNAQVAPDHVLATDPPCCLSHYFHIYWT